MKIPQKLPQFEKETALLVVTGLHAGRVYHAHNGEIQRDAIVIELIPHYSDKEGFFMRRGRGMQVSGAVREIQKQFVIDRFLKRFLVQLDTVVQKTRPTVVYVFSPPELHRKLRRVLPRALVQKIRWMIPGNYTHERPHMLLQKLLV